MRDEYYRHKRVTMKSGQLSLIKHFQGVALEADELNSVAVSADGTASAATISTAPGAGPNATGVLEELRAMFEVHGSTMYDPVVTQQEHALQASGLPTAAPCKPPPLHAPGMEPS